MVISNADLGQHISILIYITMTPPTNAMASRSYSLYLPPEVLLIIFSHCDLRTLKILRLLSKASNEELVPNVFRILILDFLPQSVKAAQMIASSPTLALHVREIIISDNILKKYSFEDFRRQLYYNINDPEISEDVDSSKPENDNPKTLVVSSTRSCRVSFNLYCRFVSAQREIITTDKAKLHQIFAKLTNLDTIKLRSLDEMQSSKAWNLFSKAVFGVSGSFSLYPWTLPALKEGEKKLSILGPVIRQICQMNQPIFRVQVSFVPSHCWMLPDISTVCSILKVLDIRIEDGQFPREKFIVRRAFRNLILNLVAIEKLKLEMTPSCGYLARCDFGEIFADVKLTLLQDLQLQTGLITSPALVKIFDNHADTLNTFSVVDFHVTDCTWTDVYMRLRNIIRHNTIVFEGLTQGDGWTTDTALPFGQRLIIDEFCVRECYA